MKPTALKPFSLWPVVMMTLLSVGLVNHVIVVPLLLNVAKRDAWLCVPVALIIVLPIVALPLHRVLIKLNGERIDTWMKRRMPRFISWLFIVFFIVISLLVAFGTMVDVVRWTSATYLPETPQLVVCCIFGGLCLYAAIAGLRTIAYISCILLPVVVLLGDFVMSANMPAKDYHYLLPMLENGFSPVLRGALNSLTSFLEITFLLLIQHHFKSRFKAWHLILLTLGFGLLTLGPTIGAITEFGPEEASNMRYPAYSQWRMVKIGDYFEHVDFFAVFQWLSGAFIRIAVPIYIANEFGPFKRLKRQWIGMSAAAMLIVAATCVMLNHMRYYRMLLGYYYSYAWIILFAVLLFLWAISAKTGRTKAIATGGRRR
ncbi:endospore germination permease [Paenibacillus gorillae]|uniref:endospore germination permease n=1 Tax=Paenibacillus gorillae TaxID=1243662 RepID=UPI0004AFA0F6|nr:endospore germination permease [Paenibacillus gorillae]